MPASETNPVDPRYPATAGGDLYAYPIQEGDGSTFYFIVTETTTEHAAVLLSAAELRDFAVACIGMVAKEEARV